jgi:carbonic anhydrase
MFVHRNVANVVVPGDLNCLSVLQYAVEVLGVRHLIVCGHYGCGGVKAALAGTKLGLIDDWLSHVQDIHQKYALDLDALEDPAVRADRLCELNVLEQAVHVCETPIVRDAWARGQDLTVHAWVYRLDDGLLRDLGFCVTAPARIEPALARAVAETGRPG